MAMMSPLSPGKGNGRLVPCQWHHHDQTARKLCRRQRRFRSYSIWHWPNPAACPKRRGHAAGSDGAMNLLSSIDTTELPVTELDADELWYKDAIIYQLHVKAFADSNNDGIGDFAGLTEKLGYLQELGVTTLWLLPFYPSPGRDDGYDIADYGSINPDFGTMKDFKRFIQEAKKRGLRVITELVVNHTSDHPDS